MSRAPSVIPAPRHQVAGDRIGQRDVEGAGIEEAGAAEVDRLVEALDIEDRGQGAQESLRVVSCDRRSSRPISNWALSTATPI